MNYLRKLQKKKFGELLIEEGLITRVDLNRALTIQDDTGEMLGEILLDQGLILEQDIARIIVKQYGLPFLLTRNHVISVEVRDLFDVKFLYDNLIIPLDTFDDIITLAIGRISALDFVDELRQKSGREPFIYVGLISDIRSTLRREFPNQFTEFDGFLSEVKDSIKKKVDPRIQPFASA